MWRHLFLLVGGERDDPFFAAWPINISVRRFATRWRSRRRNWIRKLLCSPPFLEDKTWNTSNFRLTLRRTRPWERKWLALRGLSLFVYGGFTGGWKREGYFGEIGRCIHFMMRWEFSREFVQLWKERGRQSSLTVCQVFSTRSICKYLKRIYVYICVILVLKK